MKQIALLALLIAISMDGGAQHVNSWIRGTLSYQFSLKWRTDAEIQARRQNGLGTNNPIDKKLLYSYRYWVYYKQSEFVQIGLSPFAYYTLYTVIRDSDDYEKPPLREYRLSASIDIQHRLLQNLYIFDRTAFEYRMFTNGNAILRMRNKLGMSYQISKVFSIKGTQEILLNTAGKEKPHLLDHGRTSLSAELKTSRKFLIELGYVYIVRPLENGRSSINENNFMLNVGYSLNKNKIQK